MKIGSNREVLEQLICIAHSSHYNMQTAQAAVSLIVCVAQAAETHHHLASDNIIGGITDIYTYRSESEDHTTNEVMLLRSV